MRKMMKRAGAVVLSLAVAMSMLFSLAALPQMKVSAAEEMSRLKKWSLIAGRLGDDAYFLQKNQQTKQLHSTLLQNISGMTRKSSRIRFFCSRVKDYFGRRRF